MITLCVELLFAWDRIIVVSSPPVLLAVEALSGLVSHNFCNGNINVYWKDDLICLSWGIL
jgi:hypothetical protein